jgi:ribose transport system substrate-binding protein
MPSLPITQRIAALLLIAGTVSLLSGCSKSTTTTETTTTPAPAGAPLIAFVTNNASDYWNLAHGGVNKAANELKDVSVQFVEPGDGTAATQTSDVNDLIVRGAKAIAISPVDPANQVTWLDSVAAKVPVITQDSDAPTSKRVCYVGSDNHAAGVMCGGLIKKALGATGGKIMIFVGDKDAQNAHDRIQGVEDALKGSNITVVDIRTDNTDHALAKQNAADAMTANPDLAAEVGIWSYNGPAIASAVEDAHATGKIKVICFDQEPGTIAGIKSGTIYGTVVQDPYMIGYKSTKLMDQLLHGDSSGIPASHTIYIPTQAVTSSNITQYSAILAKEQSGT